MKTRIRAALIGVALLPFAPAVALAGVCFSVTGLSQPVGIDFTLSTPSPEGGIPFLGEAYGVCGRGGEPAPVQGTAIPGSNVSFIRAGFNVFSHRPGCSDAKAEIVFQSPFTTGNGLWRYPEGSVANVVLTHDPSGSACQVGTPPATACVDSDTALCLHQKRFRVTVTRQTPPPPAPGLTVKAGSESGYFYIVQNTNVELTVKVLNGCGLNQRYWVFVSATTNIQYTVTVTDTQTGATQTYANALGFASNPVQDTNAFSTCP